MINRFRLDTGLWSPDERWEGWRDALTSSSAYEAVYHSPSDVSRFSATLKGSACTESSYALVQTRFSGNRACRDRRHVDDGFNSYLLIMVVQGQGVIQRAEQAVELKPGYVYLVDLAQPLETQIPGTMNMISVHIPRQELEDLIRGRQDRKILVFPADSGYAWLLRNYLQMLPVALDDVADNSANIFSPIRDLIAPLLFPTAGAAPGTMTSRDTVLVSRSLELIRQHCGEDNFCVDSLSNLMRLSPASLHKLLKGQGRRFSHELKKARIEKARSLLLEQDDGVSMTRLATDCGFKSLSQFSRSFKELVGCTPTDYRRQLL